MQFFSSWAFIILMAVFLLVLIVLSVVAPLCVCLIVLRSSRRAASRAQPREREDFE